MLKYLVTVVLQFLLLRGLFQPFTYNMVGNRVESGSDDPDNVGHLGHFFDGSSGSHPQTKLSGCDLDFLVH